MNHGVYDHVSLTAILFTKTASFLSVDNWNSLFLVHIDRQEPMFITERSCGVFCCTQICTFLGINMQNLVYCIFLVPLINVH